MPRSRITAQQRRHVIERAKGCCEYCLCQVNFATQSFSVEHIVAVNHGGTNTLDNLALACQGCNNHKYTKREKMELALSAQGEDASMLASEAVY